MPVHEALVDRIIEAIKAHESLLDRIAEVTRAVESAYLLGIKDGAIGAALVLVVLFLLFCRK